MVTAKKFHEQFIKCKTQNVMFPVLDWKKVANCTATRCPVFAPPPTSEELPTPLPYSTSNAIRILKLLKKVQTFKAIFLLQIHCSTLWVEVLLNVYLKICKSYRVVHHAIFLFYQSFTEEKSMSFTSLYSFFQPKLAQGLLVVFGVCYVSFHFLMSNKDSELVHVFFVYFISFIIHFIFTTKVLYLQMNA